MEQVKKYNPPPNPAKLTDPRSDGYVAEYGSHSWEVDALPPEVLAQIVRYALDGVRDWDALQVVLDQEESDKTKLQEALEAITRVK